MSGIVGILHLDRTPVDGNLLSVLTASLVYRGPDQQRTWLDGHVGFGHTLLKTTDEFEHETQPFTLDGFSWIVADARIDARQKLIAELQARGEDVRAGVTDVELVLRAYRVWGEDCVAHLIGDFAFAVWDARARRLLCARDQLGVKPFYFAHVGQALVFSNSLDCIRRHPAVSDSLNDQAIADFLLFELNQNPSTTTLADIQRLPPAHRAIWDDRGVAVQRYWTMPIDEPVFFAKDEDYLEGFTDVVRTAISDRLRTSNVSVLMSGGLDSTSLAAFASELARARGASDGVHAFTLVLNGLDGDEGYYAHLTAAHLRIPISTWDLSERLVDPGWERAAIRIPEPVANPTQLTSHLAQYRALAAYSRVSFYGEGPDNALMFEWQPYLAYLLRTRRPARLLWDVGRHAALHRRVPLLPTLPRMWRAWRERRTWDEPFPSWFEPTFESRLKLRERWESHRHGGHGSSAHPIRPASYAGLNNVLWEALFRSFDAEVTSTPLEFRHPYVDLRVLRYCLALPAVPWCRRKFIVRQAMRGRLPGPVLKRNKTPLNGDPLWHHARRFGLPPHDPTPQLAAYVDAGRFESVTADGMLATRTDFRPRALNHWLSNGAARP
jgi:asparagine synthase (glutamine-hydrolysing)